MAQVLSVISAIAGICKIIQFGQQEFASHNNDDSTIKIHVGLDYKGGLQNAEGDLPDVRLFNEAGQYLGMTADPGHVGDGSEGQVTVDQSDASQATYTLFSANDDAICVAYASITWPDKNHYGWTGDWGKQCGGSWFYSHVYINNKNYKPACLWIDADGDQPQTGFSLHWPEFVSKSGKLPSNTTTDYFCNNNAVFQLHTENDPSTIAYWPLGQGGGKARRSEPADPIDKRETKMYTKSAKFSRSDEGEKKRHIGDAKHRNKLVISNDAMNHPAAGLCESDTSLGPDFLNSAEGQFCRMEDKTLFPVCDNKVKDNCFNADTHNIIVGGKATRDSAYEMVIDWTDN